MINEPIIKKSFKKAKEDVEGVKNELAFALRRIAKIEELLSQQALEDLILKAARNMKKPAKAKKAVRSKKKRTQKIKRKIIEY